MANLARYLHDPHLFGAPLTLEDACELLHGTSSVPVMDHHSGCVTNPWENIRTTGGLSPMGRVHIHFSKNALPENR